MCSGICFCSLHFFAAVNEYKKKSDKKEDCDDTVKRGKFYG